MAVATLPSCWTAPNCSDEEETLWMLWWRTPTCLSRLLRTSLVSAWWHSLGRAESGGTDNTAVLSPQRFVYLAKRWGHVTCLDTGPRSWAVWFHPLHSSPQCPSVCAGAPVARVMWSGQFWMQAIKKKIYSLCPGLTNSRRWKYFPFYFHGLLALCYKINMRIWGLFFASKISAVKEN